MSTASQNSFTLHEFVSFVSVLIFLARFFINLAYPSFLTVALWNQMLSKFILNLNCSLLKITQVALINFILLLLVAC